MNRRLDPLPLSRTNHMEFLRSRENFIWQTDRDIDRVRTRIDELEKAPTADRDDDGIALVREELERLEDRKKGFELDMAASKKALMELQQRARIGPEREM